MKRIELISKLDEEQYAFIEAVSSISERDLLKDIENASPEEKLFVAAYCFTRMAENREHVKVYRDYDYYTDEDTSLSVEVAFTDFIPEYADYQGVMETICPSEDAIPQNADVTIKYKENFIPKETLYKIMVKVCLAVLFIKDKSPIEGFKKRLSWGFNFSGSAHTYNGVCTDNYWLHNKLLKIDGADIVSIQTLYTSFVTFDSEIIIW